VPQSGIRNPYDYSRGGGFLFTDDIIIPGGVGKQIHNGAQWREANLMEVAMEEKLCKATTGQPCPS
jgi:RNA-splicing ligase RtcB